MCLHDNELVMRMRFIFAVFRARWGGGNYLRIARTNFGANEKKFTDHNAFSLTATTQRFRATASMAAIDSKKNTFWKKGGSGTKIPGR